MATEAFVRANGETLSAWDVTFTNVEQHCESAPCAYHERDGSFRKGQVFFTVETARVTFRANGDAWRVGLDGQLSSEDDKFYDVTVISAEPEDDHLRVVGRASRKFSYERNR